MEQIPSWEANRFSASQEIPRILWNPKVHYLIHQYQPPVRIPSQLDPIHTPTSHFLKSHLCIILSFTPGYPKWSLSLRPPHQNPVYASRAVGNTVRNSSVISGSTDCSHKVHKLRKIRPNCRQILNSVKIFTLATEIMLDNVLMTCSLCLNYWLLGLSQFVAWCWSVLINLKCNFAARLKFSTNSNWGFNLYSFFWGHVYFSRL